MPQGFYWGVVIVLWGVDFVFLSFWCDGVYWGFGWCVWWGFLGWCVVLFSCCCWVFSRVCMLFLWWVMLLVISCRSLLVGPCGWLVYPCSQLCRVLGDIPR